MKISSFRQVHDDGPFVLELQHAQMVFAYTAQEDSHTLPTHLSGEKRTFSIVMGR
jgi:hypothetical protein